MLASRGIDDPTTCHLLCIQGANVEHIYSLDIGQLPQTSRMYGTFTHER